MSDETTTRSEGRIRAGQTVRVVVVAVVVVVLGAWALANQDDVEVDWLFDTTEGPLVLVIAVSAALGFFLGVVLSWRRRRD